MAGEAALEGKDLQLFLRTLGEDAPHPLAERVPPTTPSLSCTPRRVTATPRSITPLPLSGVEFITEWQPLDQ